MRISRTAKAEILLLLVTLCWGTTFVLVKSALDEMPPLFFNAVRTSVACLALAIVYWRRLPAISGGSWLAGGAVGLALYVGLDLQTVGLRYTTPSKSAFVTGIAVLLVPLLAGLI